MNIFNVKSRVYYEDTDAGGIVYHANYLKFMERARTEWVRDKGVVQQKMLEQSLAFVVIDMHIAFKLSAKLDDLIQTTCQVTKLKRASIEFVQEVRKGDSLLVSANVKIACVDSRLNKPVAIPKALFNKIKAEIN